MAKVVAETFTKQVEKTIVVNEEYKTYRLHLDENEARVLVAILSRVGGPPEPHYLRGISQKIYDALAKTVGHYSVREPNFRGHLVFEAVGIDKLIDRNEDKYILR